MSPDIKQVRPGVMIFSVTFLATALPLLLYFLRYPTAAPICLFAGDAFYYLDIARNSAGHAGFTFDGIHLTNGFHPLWEWLLTFCHHIGVLQSKAPFRDLGIVYCINLFFLAFGGALVATVTSRFLRQPWLSAGVVAPGYLSFLLAIGGANLASWSFLNGMESGLALFLIAAAILAALPFRTNPSRDSIFSLLLGLGILARLDEVFLLLAFLAVAVWLEHLPPRRLLARFLPAAVLISGYVLYNHHTLGVYLPTSGSIKAGIGVLENTKFLLKQFLPVITGDKPAMLPGDHTIYGFGAVYVRTVQMVVPAVICVVEMIWQMRRRTGVERAYIISLCLGVILKAAYNFVFVRLFNQGEWYYVISFAITNLVLAMWLDRLLQAVAVNGFTSSRVPLKVVVAGYVLCTSFTFNAFISYRSYYSTVHLFSILRDGDSIRQRIDGAGYSRFLEFDDGGLGYGLRLPSTAGFGLALDPEAIHALQQHTFFELMMRRDVRLEIGADAYGSQLVSYLAARDWEQGKSFNEISAVEFRQFRLRLIQNDLEHGLVLFQLEPTTVGR